MGVRNEVVPRKLVSVLRSEMVVGPASTVEVVERLLVLRPLLKS